MKNFLFYGLASAVLIPVLFCSVLVASSEQTIFVFPANGSGGNTPTGGLISDAAGNLYGVTEIGGSFGNGAVFKLSFESGVWSETVLYSFLGASFADGSGPYSALLLDAAGNLYGTTAGGGPSGNGTVFKLAPDGSGGWTETILHAFNGTDGSGPVLAPLVSDAQGNLYGVTDGGCVFGHCANGTIFELIPRQNSSWSYKVLHSFGHTGLPLGGLVFDKSGKLYGTTTYDGPKYCSSLSGCGTIYKLSHGPKSWAFGTIHAFNYTDGEYPEGNLILDSSGNIYGTTLLGGAYNGGVAFRLSLTKTGWKETVLYVFGAPGDGQGPSSLVFGSAGHLFGSVPSSIDVNYNFQNGYVFELSRQANGTWSETVLYAFPQGNSVSFPNSSLIWNNAGTALIGTLGPDSDPAGAVYEVAP